LYKKKKMSFLGVADRRWGKMWVKKGGG